MNSDEILSIFKRRGVLWPTAEIYGGAQGLYDYGPMGSALKRRLEDAWEAWFVGLSQNYHRIDAVEMLPEAVVRASGHLDHFADPLVTCGNCGTVIRADELLEAKGQKDAEALKGDELAARLEQLHPPCPRCGKGPLGPPRAFNLMFGMEFGALGKEKAYLRPETAQSSYLAFSRMWNIGRKKLPMGIAVIGKAFRNEIAPRQTLFRMRVFTQAELQIFFDPEDYPSEWKAFGEISVPILFAEKRLAGAVRPEEVSLREVVEKGYLPPFYAFHMAHTYRFFRDVLGYPAERIRFLEKNERERAFYNRIQFDVEAELVSLGGFKEVGAIHYRGDYDLTKHSEGSKTDLSVTTEGGKHLTPHVLELTFGVDRNVWALSDIHLRKDGERLVWSLPSYLAPVTVGVLPLIPKEHGVLAQELADALRSAGVSVTLDESGSVGRRYARLDEMGTPLAVTIDGQSKQDRTFTIRERETKEQRRVGETELLPLATKPAVPPWGCLAFR